jgi:hypothetical protein
VVKNRPPGDVFRAFESTEPADGAGPIDEYRELTLLAGAWEAGALKPRAAKRAPGRADDAEGKEPARR